jgi:hypothetical protein
MTRRAWLTIAIAGCCRAAADPAREVFDLVADAAGSLSAGDAAGFLRAFDRTMPGYAKLRENVTGLLALGDVQSAIDPLEDAGDGLRRTAQFQWTLRILRGQQATASIRREQVVKCTVEKQGGKWRITAIEPVEFFAP